MDRRRFFTAAGTTAALVGLRTEHASADDRIATPTTRFDAGTVKAMRDRIHPIAPDDGARLLLPQATSLQQIFG